MTLTNCYTDIATVKQYLNLADSSKDARVEQAISAACRQIDGWCSQRFWADASVKVREFYADNALSCMVVGDNCPGISDTTGLIVAVDVSNNGAYTTTLTLNTNFLLLPQNAADEVPPSPYTELRIVDTGVSFFPMWSQGRPGVRVTAKFGWPSIPEEVTSAAIIQAVQVYKAADAPFGTLQLATFDGVGIRTGSSIHPQAKALLADYRLPAIG